MNPKSESPECAPGITSKPSDNRQPVIAWLLYHDTGSEHRRPRLHTRNCPDGPHKGMKGAERSPRTRRSSRRDYAHGTVPHARITIRHPYIRPTHRIRNSTGKSGSQRLLLSGHADRKPLRTFRQPLTGRTEPHSDGNGTSYRSG